MDAATKAYPYPSNAPICTSPTAPVHVHWYVVSDSNGSLRVNAVIEREGILPVPLDVRVEVPSGLAMVSGPAAFQVPSEGEQRRTVVEYSFKYSRAPTADLRLMATATTVGFGVHASDSYRFGRPALKKHYAKPTGPEVRIGHINLGQLINLDR